eukprot:GHVS01096258.1.p1 GENE.GHVS01096258.1~~GHVS01096258.1.p1  ORF type:complete len:139 (-),score=3.93 GHVS01096258.1:862-1278(-)
MHKKARKSVAITPSTSLPLQHDQADMAGTYEQTQRTLACGKLSRCTCVLFALSFIYFYGLLCVIIKVGRHPNLLLLEGRQTRLLQTDTTPTTIRENFLQDSQSYIVFILMVLHTFLGWFFCCWLCTQRSYQKAICVSS